MINEVEGTPFKIYDKMSLFSTNPELTKETPSMESFFYIKSKVKRPGFKLKIISNRKVKPSKEMNLFIFRACIL